jgi:hypothetical protein
VFLLGCSGPCVGFLMMRAESFGFVSAGACLLVLGALVVRAVRAGRISHAVALVLLAVVNPGWWYSPFHGDCGFTRVDAAQVWLALTAGLASAALFALPGFPPLFQRKRGAFGLIVSLVTGAALLAVQPWLRLRGSEWNWCLDNSKRIATCGSERDVSPAGISLEECRALRERAGRQWAPKP